MADYTATYIQRDVRQVINIGDLQSFSGFVKLCAGRTAQEINLSSLGGDAGISHNTVCAWLSVLETQLHSPSIDLLIDQSKRLDAIEIKSGATASPDFFRNLQRFPERLGDAGESRPVGNHVVYGGDEVQQRSYAQLVSWREAQRILTELHD